MAFARQELARPQRAGRNKPNDLVAAPPVPAPPEAPLIAPLIDGQRLLRVQDVLALVGFSRASLFRYTTKGLFPAPVRVGKRRIVWRASDVNVWFAQLHS